MAIAVKRGIHHSYIDDSDQEFLAVDVETSREPIVLVTCYLPPHHPFLPYPDILRILRVQMPVYPLGDLNARHRTLGHADNNVGTSVSKLMSGG